MNSLPTIIESLRLKVFKAEGYSEGDTVVCLLSSLQPQAGCLRVTIPQTWRCPAAPSELNFELNRLKSLHLSVLLPASVSEARQATVGKVRHLICWRKSSIASAICCAYSPDNNMV